LGMCILVNCDIDFFIFFHRKIRKFQILI